MNEIDTGRKLVLHLDVNNTVLIGDSRTKQVTLSAALNEYLVDVAWGRLEGNDDWKMYSVTLSEKPPTASCGLLSYYRFAEAKYIAESRDVFKSHIRKFTEEKRGKPFKCYHDQMLTALTFPGKVDGRNTASLPAVKESDGLAYHRIVPSFYKLLHHLHATDRDFAIAFRTFGIDGNVALQATKDFLAGGHVSAAKTCAVDMSPGVISRSSHQVSLKLSGDSICQNLNDIYTYFSQLHCVKLFVDDYSWWKTQGYHSKAGKPLLIDLSDTSVHHVMFDDNFRSWEPKDSIVDLRVAKEGNFTCSDPEMLEDICIVKADLFQSICNQNYFIDKVQLCERNYSRLLAEK